MVFSPVVANSADPGVEELMAEGISFPSHPESNRRYCGDKSIPSTEEMMGEGIAVPQAEVKKKYVYDTSAPSASEMLSEGVCLNDLASQPGKDKKLSVTIARK